MKKMYKVLNIKNNHIFSPYRNFCYGELDKIKGKEFICEDFDVSDRVCSNGFYAVMPEGLPYCINQSKSCKVFEVEMSGKNIKFNNYKHRWEKQKIIKMLSEEELKKIVFERQKILDYNLYNIIRPSFNTDKLKTNIIDDNIINLLKQVDLLNKYDYGCNYMTKKFNFVRDSVLESIQRSKILSNLEISIYFNSIQDYFLPFIFSEQEVWIILGSCFSSSIKNWKYMNCKDDKYPFQCYCDLYKLGLVPNFDGIDWELYSGNRVVYKISRKELRKM